MGKINQHPKIAAYSTHRAYIIHVQSLLQTAAKSSKRTKLLEELSAIVEDTEHSDEHIYSKITTKVHNLLSSEP